MLATGGGAVLDPDNRALLRARGLVVYLHAQPRDLWQRTRHDKSRPLLQVADPRARVEELYRMRDPLYREVADLVVDTGRQSVNVLVNQLLRAARTGMQTLRVELGEPRLPDPYRKRADRPAGTARAVHRGPTGGRRDQYHGGAALSRAAGGRA